MNFYSENTSEWQSLKFFLKYKTFSSYAITWTEYLYLISRIRYVSLRVRQGTKNTHIFHPFNFLSGQLKRIVFCNISKTPIKCNAYGVITGYNVNPFFYVRISYMYSFLHYIPNWSAGIFLTMLVLIKTSTQVFELFDWVSWIRKLCKYSSDNLIYFKLNEAYSREMRKGVQ